MGKSLRNLVGLAFIGLIVLYLINNNKSTPSVIQPTKPAVDYGVATGSTSIPSPSQTATTEPLSVVTYTLRLSRLGNPITIDGLLTNTTDSPRENVNIVATLLGSNGEIIGVGQGGTSSSPHIARPRSLFPFEVSIRNVTSTTFSVKLQVGSDEYGSFHLYTPYNNFGIDKFTSDVIKDQHVIRGQIINAGKSAATQTKIIAVLYDENQGVADVEYTYAPVDPIAPGDSSPFELTSDFAGEIGSIRVFVDALTD